MERIEREREGEREREKREREGESERGNLRLKREGWGYGFVCPLERRVERGRIKVAMGEAILDCEKRELAQWGRHGIVYHMHACMRGDILSCMPIT